MTITEAVEYVRRMHNAETDSHWSDAEIYKLFEKKSNECLRVIGLIEATDTSTTTVASTADYALPSNFVFVKRVYWDGKPLKLLSTRQRDARVPSGTAPTGTPREYTLWNNTITLTPTPSSAETLTIVGEKEQSSITTSSSSLDTPSVWHGALCDGVIAEMYAKDLNMQFAQLFEGKWGTAKQEMREFVIQRRRRGGYAVTVDTDSSLETEFGVV